MNTRPGNLALPKALSLQGKRALVAGAAGGIGRAAAVCLAELGADLVLADRATLDDTRAEVEAVGRTAVMLQGDLTDEGFLQRIVASGPYFSVAYVAGVFRGPEGASPQEAFDFVMHVNVRAALILGGALIDQMSGGYMVLVGSTAGRSGAGRLGTETEYATYAASKGAVHTLVRVLARRGAAKGILVNGVAPGLVRTPMLHSVRPDADAPGRTGIRPADPQELGWPIALLCSPMASYISGAIVDVNGGSFIG
ncbi:MAG TPA: SDR family oxidoreductase [Steroidobacteraceae bacterium]|jgi:3-oxoacyl-[acyl-carrier protein] reductase